MTEETTEQTEAKPVPNAVLTYQETKELEAKQAAETPKEEISDQVEDTKEIETKDQNDDSAPSQENDDTPKGVQKRFNKLTAEKYELKRQLEQIQKENELLKLRPKEEVTSKKEEKSSDDRPVAPNLEDFEEYADYQAADRKYVEDLIEWKADQKLKNYQQEITEKSLKSEYEQKVSNLVQQMNKYAEAHEGYNESINDMLKIGPVPPAVDSLIMESENGAELYDHLASDLGFYEKLQSMDPAKQIFEFGRFISSFSKPEVKPTTKAPAPLEATRGKGSIGKLKLNDPNLSQAEYEKRRAAGEI